jgi:Lipocalin-like domain
MSAKKFHPVRSRTSWAHIRRVTSITAATAEMIVIIVGSNRTKPAAPVATPTEAAALLKSMLAYAGTFTVDSTAKTVTHHVEISWDESRTGTDQVRHFSLDGNTLKLTTDPSTDPATGEKTIRELVWERAH